MDGALRASAEVDPRLETLLRQGWRCEGCGERHEGLFDLSAPAPAHWSGRMERASNEDLTFDGDFLSDDFCVLGGEHFFVRCVLPLPLIGVDAEFCFGVWSSLSRESFEAYVDSFAIDAAPARGPWFGWFSNRLAGYPDTLELRCSVYPQRGGHRPEIELDDSDHPLAREQRAGIDVDRLLEIYAENGHAPVTRGRGSEENLVAFTY